MNVNVIGARGMLGTDLMAVLGNAGVDVKGYDLPELDVTRDDGGLENIDRCDCVINCAAYTDVDGAEQDVDKAFSVNKDGARRVAGWCRRTGSRLIHISTDYVFDGKSGMPYREDTTVNPLNVYGRSKLAGEKEIITAGASYIIIRTQSLFGVNGKNFVKAIMEQLDKDDAHLKVVDDQSSSPTYTVHLADAILRLMKVSKQGIVNVSAEGKCTWFAFACEIASCVNSTARILPVTSKTYVRPAKRPAYSILDKTLYKSWTGCVMPTWKEGLKEYLERIRV